MPETDVLKVHMLGEFSLSYGDVTVNDQCSRSKKMWVLLEYLITFRNKELSQNDLVELLWPDDEIANPSNTLKTLLHRTRAVVAPLGFSGGKDLVISRRGAYAWNTNIPIWVDADEFDQRCKAAERYEDPDLRLPLLLAAIDLYRGDFLPKTALEPWAVPIAAYYHAQYMKIVRDALAILESQQDYEEIISVCQKAVTIDPYDESLYQSLIMALSKSGNHQGAMLHYEYVTELFYNQFGVTPSEELTALYREIVKTENVLELDLGAIKQNLMENEKTPGAFFCEYEFFKDIYKLNARSSVRNGQVTQLVLLTMVGKDGEVLDKKTQRVNMDRLKACIGSSLRRGDVYTRYSVSQYLLMLSSASYENSEMVANRILRAFRRQHPKGEASIHFKILPLDPEF